MSVELRRGITLRLSLLLIVLMASCDQLRPPMLDRVEARLSAIEAKLDTSGGNAEHERNQPPLIGIWYRIMESSTDGSYLIIKPDGSYVGIVIAGKSVFGDRGLWEQSSDELTLYRQSQQSLLYRQSQQATSEVSWKDVTVPRTAHYYAVNQDNLFLMDREKPHSRVGYARK